MPRKAPDRVEEQRITLGNLERDALRSMIITQRAQVASSTLTGIAGAVSAGSLLLAAAAFAAWKAPGIVKEAAGNLSQATQDALGVVVARNDEGRLTVEPGVGGLGGVGGVLDFVTNKATNGIIELRREAQALAKERGQVAREINAFCSINANSYDQAKCNAAQDRKDAYFVKLKDFRKRVAAWEGPLGNDPRMIYKGLGDIDPNYEP